MMGQNAKHQKRSHSHNDDLLPDARQDGEAKSTSKGHSRSLPDIIEVKPELCNEMVNVPLSCSATTKAMINVCKGDINPSKSTHIRMNKNQQQSFQNQKNELCERKTATKRCNVPFIQNSNTFQDLNYMDFLLNKSNQVTLGKPSVKGRPNQFVPFNQPLAVSCTEAYTPVNKTKITVFLPPMSYETENQLLRVFYDISKLHSCNFSVDRKDTPMRDEGRISDLASQHHDTSQEPIKVPAIQKRKSQQLTKKQQKSVTFPELRLLQSKLHSLGTHIQPIDVRPEQTQYQGSSSDSDSFPPLYPEVVMQYSP